MLTIEETVLWMELEQSNDFKSKETRKAQAVAAVRRMHIKLLQFCANHSRRLLISSSIKIISRKEMSCVIPVKFERLPELAKPTHYALTLSPDFKSFTFRGQETADIEVSCIIINKILIIA
ncbi:hypothetical protein LOAG_09320 [Loa loa]|uniref:Uncharacterized protein n=1 Tax=Loa loa TaxID=7209 RepID=A0A1S0TTP3_LOALO|nr:hypothetical protein LOAG_09320 [Loa loa]EFO19177.2 hypothetical protein LOAG_09320 [Loa loa]